MKLKICILILIFGAFLTSNADAFKNPHDYPYIIEHVNQIDPHENFNRNINDFNSFTYSYILKPVTVTWTSIMPEHGIKCIGRFLITWLTQNV
ncbi:MAG: VacJ family lipoprotein [Lentisphaerae bacterium]|nr:VacJ family lipoprotein [Lentisphaerota bacterium]MCP4102869.1 VacJ family lipoprotein [Lentisphaerota bacterium]